MFVRLLQCQPLVLSPEPEISARDLAMLAFDTLTHELAEFARQQYQRLINALDETQQQQLQQACEEADFARCFLSTLVASQYCVDYWCSKPESLQQLLQEQALQLPLSKAYHRDNLSRLLSDCDSEQALHSILRRYRMLQMSRFIYRDCSRLATMSETCLEVTYLADASIDLALDYLYQSLCEELGTPLNAEGEAQRMVVIGMGKLGAEELNLSSDIDLIFTFPEGGQTQGGRKRSIDNQAFFNRLGQRLIKALDVMTADGFVFRTDMRLRPYGQSGALALNFDAIEEYYQDQGREWERYAMIKARIVAGDKEAGEQLMALLRPFTYRRYVDYSAFESLRSMKDMIHREVKRKGKLHDVKLGPGGIREIEFIAQVFQLIRGGCETELQTRNLCKVLGILRDLGFLPGLVVSELSDAYEFLRNTEHAIQGQQDKQTQSLPDEPLAQSRLAYAMGFDSWELFYAALEVHRERVDYHFQQVIAAPQEEDEESLSKTAEHDWHDVWHDGGDLELATAKLAERGFDQAQSSAQCILALRDGSQVVAMQNIGRERLDQFMPLLLTAALEVEQPSQALERVLKVVESVLRRTAYLMLLIENPGALKQLLRLSSSTWIIEQVSLHPVLLDELLNAHALYNPPAADELQAELRQQLLRVDPDDLEVQMDTLRYFKLAHALRIAAAEVAKTLPLMKVSDYLSAIAEVVLNQVLALAWDAMVTKHGQPLNSAGEPCELDFIIIAYGKLGGLELGHGSDLDLVFIHNGGAGQMSNGARPLDSSQFFNRLGQKIIHFLNTHTRLGQLYEVDMRLRPSGNSGLLVSSLEAFEKYQLQDAWTWEHQAIVRARVVAGSADLAKRFEQIRATVLSRPRDKAELAQEVEAMRDKMMAHLAPKAAESQENADFDLKHSRGGIVDIEFMVQYAVLAWSEQYPQLHRYTDNIRILEQLSQQQLLTEVEARGLIEVYQAYRSTVHLQVLQRHDNKVAGDRFMAERRAVADLWQRLVVAAKA